MLPITLIRVLVIFQSSIRGYEMKGRYPYLLPSIGEFNHSNREVFIHYKVLRVLYWQRLHNPISVKKKEVGLAVF